MRSRSICNSSSMMGLAIGIAAGLAAGLLAAPMRGTAMRETLRQRAADGSSRLQHLFEDGSSRLQHLIEEGRRALSTRSTPESLTAPLGEIASIHEGSRPTSFGAIS